MCWQRLIAACSKKTTTNHSNVNATRWFRCCLLDLSQLLHRTYQEDIAGQI